MESEKNNFFHDKEKQLNCICKDLLCGIKLNSIFLKKKKRPLLDDLNL